MDVTTGGSVQDSVKKRKKSTVVSSDGFLTDRIKALKHTITGPKREDNEWTKMLRAKLVQDTVQDELEGDRTFKTNQEWVVPTPTVSRGEQEFPTLWVCPCTKG